MSETWVRRFLYFAGAWNVIGGASALADPTRHFAQVYKGAVSLDDPLQAFFFRATWINVIAWGIGYILGTVPRIGRTCSCCWRRRQGSLLRLCLALFFSGRGSTMLLAAGILDVIFAAFFAYVLWLQRPGQPAV